MIRQDSSGFEHYLEDRHLEHSDIEKSRLRDYKNLGELRRENRVERSRKVGKSTSQIEVATTAEIESVFEHYWKGQYCGTFWKVIEVERLQELRFGASSDVPTEKKVNKNEIAESELKVRCQKLLSW